LTACRACEKYRSRVRKQVSEKIRLALIPLYSYVYHGTHFQSSFPGPFNHTGLGTPLCESGSRARSAIGCAPSNTRSYFHPSQRWRHVSEPARAHAHNQPSRETSQQRTQQRRPLRYSFTSDASPHPSSTTNFENRRLSHPLFIHPFTLTIFSNLLSALPASLLLALRSIVGMGLGLGLRLAFLPLFSTGLPSLLRLIEPLDSTLPDDVSVSLLLRNRLGSVITCSL
jgi:hypothetical protein